LLLIGRLVTLPFALLVREQNLEYDLTRQSLGGWAVDRLLSLGVSWAVTSLLLLVLVGLARWAGRGWYAWVGGAAALLIVAGSFLYPVLVEPVFNRFTPLEDGPLRDQVLVLAEQQGVEVGEVLVADASRRTTTLNAYVSGLGETRRVVLYDTLLEQAPAEEVEVIVAHELAHAKHQDVLVGTALGAGGAVLGVALLAVALDSPRLRRRSGVDGAADPGSVALVLALVAVGGLVVSPLASSISRAVEMRADRESLVATGETGAFMQVHRRLAIESVSDPTPPRWSQFWFGSHPTVLQRAGLPSSLEEASR
ncbi:MAG TPA: M48 family metallopeptidase, partial [Nocardioidaceae bacterium]|nr:M48 family metallopeptidase [Nocardioidaceae bacterium]